MLEAKVLKLLKGDALNENEGLCDFTLADQNEACGNLNKPILILMSCSISKIWILDPKPNILQYIS